MQLIKDMIWQMSYTSYAQTEAASSTENCDIFFKVLHKKHCCGCSLEVSQGSASSKHPQHMFPWRN